MFDINLLLKKILIKSPLLKPYVDWANFVPTTQVNTASTDGRNVYYNPVFFASAPLEEQMFTIVHELMHIALDHVLRRGDRKKFGFNYAADAVINQIIEAFGIPIPEGDVNCPDAAGLSVEEYYEIVVNRPDYDELQKQYESDPKKQQIMGQHDMWGTEIVDTKDKPQNMPKDEKEFSKKNQELKESLAEEYMDKMLGGGTEAGHDLKTDVDQDLGNVGYATSFANWQDLLSYQVNKSRASYDFFNGEFDHEGIWTYPYQRNRVKEAEVEIVIDTSYSVSDELVRAFLREVKSIVGNAKIKIGCFNDTFDGFVEIKDESDIDNFTIKSRGGTDFEVAVKAFESPTSVKIVFTDGYGNDPKSFCEAIWIVYSPAKINPPGGFVYNVEKEMILGSKITF